MKVSTAAISACTAKSMIDGNDEFVAVEDSIDVGNVLYILYDYLRKIPVRTGLVKVLYSTCLDTHKYLCP